jgi:hypothetical protein
VVLGGREKPPDEHLVDRSHSFSFLGFVDLRRASSRETCRGAVDRALTARSDRVLTTPIGETSRRRRQCKGGKAGEGGARSCRPLAPGSVSPACPEVTDAGRSPTAPPLPARPRPFRAVLPRDDRCGDLPTRSSDGARSAGSEWERSLLAKPTQAFGAEQWHRHSEVQMNRPRPCRKTRRNVLQTTV